MNDALTTVMTQSRLRFGFLSLPNRGFGGAIMSGSGCNRFGNLFQGLQRLLLQLEFLVHHLCRAKQISLGTEERDGANCPNLAHGLLITEVIILLHQLS